MIVDGDTRNTAHTVRWYLRPRFIFAFFSFVNFLNFLDRGIIPGATSEFNAFIERNLDTNAPDAFLGLLQSSFIVGLAIGSVLFGHQVHTVGRFYLTAAGCSLWAVAVVLSGLSAPSVFDSYICLVLARMLSGSGEAALQVAIPPWIQNTAAPDERGTFLALFYTAVPVGTAVGYAYSAFLASGENALGWEWAFFIEALVMLPLIAFMLFIAPHFPCESKTQGPCLRGESRLATDVKRQSSSLLDDASAPESSNDGDAISSRRSSRSSGSRRGSRSSHASVEIEQVSLKKSCNSTTSAAHDSAADVISIAYCADKEEEIINENSSPTILEELSEIFSRPIYLSIQFGYAAQTAMLIGLSTFGSSFLMGLGYFGSESVASTVFGALISAAGIIATPLGGMLLDRGIIRAKRRSGIHTGMLHLEVDDDDNTSLQKQLLHDGPAYNPLPVEDKPCSDRDRKVHRDSVNVQLEDEDPRIRSLKLLTAFKIMTIFNAVGALAMCSVFFVQDRIVFLVLITFGCSNIFISIPSINAATMLAVPTCNQSLAIAMGIVILHLFGDVPAPVVVGLLKDELAPNCVPGSGDDDDDGVDIATSSACREDADGLKLCILLVCVWMIWCVALFGAAWFMQSTMPRFRLPWCAADTEQRLKIDEKDGEATCRG